jgi:site-specific DNA recombinase
MKALVDRRTKLEAIPARAAGWVIEKTDQTYREVWAESDHRQLLLDKGVRFELNPDNPQSTECPRLHVFTP